MNDEFILIQELNSVLPMEIINEIFSYRIMTATARIFKQHKIARIMKKFIEEVKVEVEECYDEDFEEKKDKNFCYYVWGFSNENDTMIRRAFMIDEENEDDFIDGEPIWY